MSDKQKSEPCEHEVQLAAWHSAFGTTQLSHAIAMLEAAKAVNGIFGGRATEDIIFALHRSVALDDWDKDRVARTFALIERLAPIIK